MSSDWKSWFVCVAVMAATAVGAAQQPTFRSGVDLVTVDAAVLDGDGRPVPALRAEDFRIDVDGRPRRIVSAQFVDLSGPIEQSALPSAAHFSSNAGAGDGRIVVIAVDETHIRRLEGRRALDAASRFIDGLPAIDRVGVIGADDRDGVHADARSSRAAPASRRHARAGRSVERPVQPRDQRSAGDCRRRPRPARRRGAAGVRPLAHGIREHRARGG